jgi:nucleotide-binding universal stress UspA family protein
MKKILILVDPEHLVNNVAASGLMLSAKLKTNLVLFSTYLLIPVTDVYSGTPWIDEGISLWEQDTAEKLKKLTDALNNHIEKLGDNLHKPIIETHITEGNLGTSVNHFIQNNQVEMVVMGSKSNNTIDHILMGSDTQSVINECERPILIMPKEITLKKINKVTYATDFKLEEMKALKYLFNLGERLKFHIEIVYIKQYGDDLKSVELDSLAFKEKVNKLNYPHLKFSLVNGKDVVKRLSRFADENNTDVLAMTHYQHNFFYRLMIKSITKKAVSNQKIPILVIPAKLI